VVAPYLLDSITQPASEYIRFLVNTKNTDQTFSLGNIQYSDVKSNSYSGSVTLKSYSSLILIKKGITTYMSEAENNKLKIYPNPNEGNFNISVSDGQHYKLEILNMLGQKIWNCTDFSSQEVDLKHKSKGVYIAVLSDGINMTESKFLIR
jgi:hypothetical protein